MQKMIVLLCSFLFCTVSQSLQAQIFNQIYVVLTTGSDDLRGGNHAFISLNFADGTSSDEVALTTNSAASGSFGQNGVVSGIWTMQDDEDFNAITGITIRHDGSPRPGNPFDTYDNWDLKAIRVAALTDGSGPRGVNVYNSRNDAKRRTFVVRFTGNTRSIVLPRQR